MTHGPLYRGVQVPMACQSVLLGMAAIQEVIHQDVDDAQVLVRTGIEVK